MYKLKEYIQSALYNINHNKAYAAFVIFGTALTFIFTTIVLQITNDIVNNTQPFINADRLIKLPLNYTDIKGKSIGTIPSWEIPLLLKETQGYALYSLRDVQYCNLLVNNERYLNSTVTYVNSAYWAINSFDFIAGSPFTENEVLAKEPVAIVMKNFADKNFKTNDIIGKKLEVFGITYTIKGIVDNYFNIFSGGDQIWLPYTLNKFVATGINRYEICVLPNEGISTNQLKINLVKSIKSHFKNKSIHVDISEKDLFTLKESRIENVGNSMLSYGIPIILFILLVIPSMNIISISIANTNNRAKEIAIRKALGATIFESFILLIIENFILVLVGSIIGVLSVTTVTSILIGQILDNSIFESIFIITQIDYKILIFGIAPLTLLFTLLSGGIPAHLVAKGNIVAILKGGSKC